MMDIEKMVKAVKLCGSTPKVDRCKQCAYWSGGDMSKCIPRMTTDSATALSTLQAENEKLRAEMEQVKAEKAKAIETLSENLRVAYKSRDAALEHLHGIITTTRLLGTLRTRRQKKLTREAAVEALKERENNG